MNLVKLTEAEIEAAEAAIWYDDQRAGLGDEFLAELERALNRIREQPAALAKLASYRGPHEVRRCLMGRFPYLVVFARRPTELIVVAISHARRRPLYWIERLG